MIALSFEIFQMLPHDGPYKQCAIVILSYFVPIHNKIYYLYLCLLYRP